MTNFPLLDLRLVVDGSMIEKWILFTPLLRFSFDSSWGLDNNSTSISMRSELRHLQDGGVSRRLDECRYPLLGLTRPLVLSHELMGGPQLVK